MKRNLSSVQIAKESSCERKKENLIEELKILIYLYIQRVIDSKYYNYFVKIL